MQRQHTFWLALDCDDKHEIGFFIRNPHNIIINAAWIICFTESCTEFNCNIFMLFIIEIISHWLSNDEQSNFADSHIWITSYKPISELSFIMHVIEWY